jgi:indolepyruvate ferredoxin oxidoreductase
LKWLARMRGQRGSWLDPFRFGAEKAVDRNLLADYEADLDLLARCGDCPERRQLAAWPQSVRGFGPVRAQAAQGAAGERDRLRAVLTALRVEAA